MNELLFFILGALIGALGYFLSNWHFAPVLTYRRLLEKAVSVTVFRINIMANAPYSPQGYQNEDTKNTALELRQLASDIRGLNNILDRSSFARRLCGIPSCMKLEKAASCFIYLSNSLGSRSDDLAREHRLAEVYSRIAEIEEILRVHITEDARGTADKHKEIEEIIRKRREQ